MPRVITPLNDKQIKALKPKDKAYTKADGNGLQLLIKPNGSKLWEFLYKSPTLQKRRKTSFGTYPDTDLKTARNKRTDYITKIRNGIDPLEEKQAIKQAKEDIQVKAKNTFKKIALERLELIKEDISESHYKRMDRGFKNDVFPFIGDTPINDITAKDIILILKTMMKRNVRNSTQKVHQSISKTFKWAVANDKAERNPANDIDLIEIVGKSKEQHYPSITDNAGIKNLLISIKEYQGEPSTKYALLMLAYTFVRPSNVRLALWSEIDLNAKQWVIPAKKMKTKDEFIVPLSDTLIELLKDIQLYSGNSPYLFPSTKSKTTPLSDGALLGAIRRMGYTKEEFTPHGFRAMFSTIAHEKSPFKYDVIETQLAHSVGSSVSQAYNRAKYLDERVELMQWWSDYLEEVQR
jgi:integrase